MKKIKSTEGITLVALVITIIILLILAGIAIAQLVGSGLFGKAKIARERTRYGAAKEIVELKLMEIETECIKNNDDYTLAKVADGMKEAKEITTQNYYYAKTSKVKDGLNREPRELEGVAVSVDEYKEYIFLIGKISEKRIGIIGVVKGEESDIGDKTNFKPIDEFEEEIKGGTAGGNGTGDEGETGKEPEDVEVEVPGIGGDIDISNPIEITTYMAIKNNTNNNLKLSEVENINYTIESKTKNISFEDGILIANKNADSTDSCIMIVTGMYKNQNYKNRLIIFVEPKNTENINGENYYKIYTTQDLIRLSELVNNNIGSLKNAIMMNDIDLKGIDWEPMGFWKDGIQVAAYKGIFDGNTKTIKNMKINKLKGTTDGVGFIGALDGGTVKNLKFDNPNVYSEMTNTGIVVGDSYSTSLIENVRVLNGKIESINDNTGGICGANEKYLGESASIVTNCSNNAQISVTGSNICIGGICGLNFGSNIENCCNTGTITAEGGSCIGGIAGRADNVSNISSCYNLGDITKSGNFSENTSRIGGIVGVVFKKSKVEYCCNLGNILNNSTDTYVGGIVGTLNSNNDSVKVSSIENCYNRAHVTSNGKSTGGIIGYNIRYGKVNNCYILESKQVKFGEDTITDLVAKDNNYVSRIIGYNESQNCEDVNNISDEDIPTVYNVLNKFSENASTIWSNDNPNEPSLIWKDE